VAAGLSATAPRVAAMADHAVAAGVVVAEAAHVAVAEVAAAVAAAADMLAPALAAEAAADDRKSPRLTLNMRRHVRRIFFGRFKASGCA
jgi:hypothetical protein